MLAIASPRTSSLHHNSASMPGYFEYQPNLHSERVAMVAAMDDSAVHRLDAFHDRTSTSSNAYELPKDAHVYARRALPAIPALPAVPAVPAVPTLRKSSSAKSLRSPTAPKRPSINHTTSYQVGYNQRPLPPLPNSPPRRVPSMESDMSSAESKSPDSDFECVAPLPRPRTARSISFRNFLNRNTYPSSTSSDPSQRSVSSMSSTSDASTCSYDSRHDSVMGDVCSNQCKTVAAGSSAPGSRRPSTLSISSLRNRKVTPPEVQTPPLPTRPVASRKMSTSAGAGRRWDLFHKQHPTEENEENIPPVPITPPAGATEASCRPCYYYSMRNCNGWVMGGAHGEACESCAMMGFFGSP